MFSNVVVGIDDDDGGRDAIALAQMLAGDGAKLTLVQVYQGGSAVSRRSNPEYEVKQHDRIRKLLETRRAEARIEADLRWYGSPSVGRGLHELAELTGADLLVIGSSRRSLLGRVLIGDDTSAALNGAPCAVAIAPAGYSREPAVMREVGVGYDGSPESERALKLARVVATEHHTTLSAFRAISTPAYLYLGHLGTAAPVELASVHDDVDDARERIAALGDVEPHAAYGDPVEELTLFSASLDLLVVGSRGYGPLGRLIYGGVAQRLARTARCPLLVLTRSARTALDELDQAAVEQREDVGGDLLDRPVGSHG
ncbi:MAG TPA: universal stress protein [Solirubrobacteraceae bacterium]|nr:universal stress protein [Solirubrobacteraceae bacterium]